jgi:hypothetical protein
VSWFSVDVEADGPIPGDYSMIAIGACMVSDPSVNFLGYLAPISNLWVPDALAVSGFTREETMEFPQPADTMDKFYWWIKEVNEGPNPIFAADNNGFDWSFVNWYMHHFLKGNLFGFSSRNINDIYHGLTKNAKTSFKHLRKTKHDHNPVNDATGNAEALLYMRDEMGYKVKY